MGDNSLYRVNWIKGSIIAHTISCVIIEIYISAQKNTRLSYLSGKGEASQSRKEQNLERDLDLWPCDLDQGQRSGGLNGEDPKSLSTYGILIYSAI